MRERDDLILKISESLKMIEKFISDDFSIICIFITLIHHRENEFNIKSVNLLIIILDLILR